MSTNGIIIYWGCEKEYVELDTSVIPCRDAIQSTREWWPNEQCTVEYNTSSQAKWNDSESVELKISYELANNPHICHPGALWGVSTIRFAPGDMEGEAVWHGWEQTDANETVRWSCLSDNLFKDQITRSRSEKKRASEFRTELLIVDGACVVSGEQTQSALEAAHIIPSVKKGNEVVNNGILLRADIHRLYDSGLFGIDSQGRIVDIGDVSDHYRQMLQGMEISSEIVERVREALDYRRQKYGK